MTALAAGDLTATVEGGTLLGLTSLRHRGEELLVAAEALPVAYRVHGARAGLTLLHPWANRIELDGDHPWTTRDEDGLALHGLARPGSWTVEARDVTTADASGRFAAVPAFPYPHEVDVRFALTDRLTVTTTVRALDAPVPLVLGWHPYVALPGAARADWVLHLPGDHAPLGERTFDDGLVGLEPGSVLAVAGGGREVRVGLGPGYGAAQVFAPGDADVVSLEPMAAPTGALQTGGYAAVQPGHPVELVFTVAVG